MPLGGPVLGGCSARIQKLNRELRELAINARREREEFREFTSRHRGSRRLPSAAPSPSDEAAGPGPD